MNPRYRRLLIPGLLTVLIIVVLLTSLARSAKGATMPIPDHPHKVGASLIPGAASGADSSFSAAASDEFAPLGG